MHPLDTAAGEFFHAIKWINEGLSNNKTLSRKRRWWIFSGEELELWLLKAAFGVYYSENVSKDREKLCDVQILNNEMAQAFCGGLILQPCGMYVMREKVIVNGLDFTPLSNDSGDRMVGLRLRFLYLSLRILFDPLTHYGKTLLLSQTNRSCARITRDPARRWRSGLPLQLGVRLIAYGARKCEHQAEPETRRACGTVRRRYRRLRLAQAADLLALRRAGDRLRANGRTTVRRRH